MGDNQYGEIGGVTRGVARSDRFIPWTHRAGHDGWKLVEGIDLEPVQALTAAGLDFTVEAVKLSDVPFFAGDPLADEHTVVRGTNGEGVFGTFSGGITVIQYAEIAEIADLVRKVHPEAQVVSAFGLHRNKQAVMCLSLPDMARECFGTKVLEFVNIFSSHNGSLKLTLQESALITQCQNTFAASLHGTKPLVQVKHTSKANDRLLLAKAAVTAAAKGNRELADFMTAQMNRRLTVKEVDAFIIKVIGPKPPLGKDGDTTAQTNWATKFAGIKAEYNAPWNKYAKYTAWGALMAVNGYEQWGAPVRKTADSGEHVRQERIVESTLRQNTPLTSTALALLK